MKYLYIRFAPYLAKTVTFESLVQDINNIITLHYVPGDEILFTAVIEKLSTFDKSFFNSILDDLGAYAQSLNIPHGYLLHDTAMEVTKDRKNVYYINTWAYITYKHSLTRHRNKWYPESKKALFLIGKPTKRQRIGLMHYFYANNLLEYLNYSLYFPPTLYNINAIKDAHIHYLQDDQYIAKFLIDIQKPSMDIDISKCYDTNVFEYTGFPTSLKYYKNTCLSIVSENSVELSPNPPGTIDMPYLTEKLYRAIINHHPFIIIGDTGTDEHLTQLGYKTFNKFFLPTVTDIDPILNWAAKSVKHFIDNLDKNVDEIREIVTHNYNHYMQQSVNEIHHLKHVLPYVDLEHVDLLGKL